MFGYVMLDKPEIKVKDFNTFKAFYCGLCRTLKKEYSGFSRLMINYDCTFLYVLCAALSESDTEYSKMRCPVSPKKKCAASDVGAEYAAAVNVLLGVGKLKDSWQDDKNIIAACGAGVYSNCYKKAARRYPDTEKCIRASLEKLSAIEKQRAASIDAPADAFAELLGNIFKYAPHNELSDVMYELGYGIGRWIYIIDAFDDLEEDIKKDHYNPIALRYPDVDEAKQQIEFTLNCSLAQAASAYELLNVKKHKDILDNIIYLGLPKKTKSILDGDKPVRKENMI